MKLRESTGSARGPAGARRRPMILAAVLLSVLVVSMDNSILYVAIKVLAEPAPAGLGASQGQLQWAVDAYIVAFASLLLSAGVVGNRVGHKRVLLAGLTCFGVFSALSALCTSPGELIAYRAVLGAAAALIMPPTLAIVTQVFPGEARAKAIGIWSAVVGAATALGPIVAGALLGSYWWGSVFLVNVPVVAVVVPAIWLAVPPTAQRERRRLDPVGVALATVGLVGVVYGVIRAGDLESLTAPKAYVPTAVGLVLLAAFAAWERRVAQPALDVRYFRNREFTAAAAAITMLYFAMLGSIFAMTFYIQSIKGYSALRTGVCLLPLAIATIIFAPRAPALVRRLGAGAVVVAGLVLVALAMLGLATLGATTSIWVFELIMFVFGAGTAHIITPVTTQMVAAMPVDQAGTSSAVNNTFRQVGGALGTAVLGSILSTTYHGRVSPDLSLLPAPLRGPAGSSIAGTLQVLRSAGGPALAYIGPADSAFMHAMHIATLVAAMAMAASAILVFFLTPPDCPPHPLHQGHNGRGGCPAMTTRPSAPRKGRMPVSQPMIPPEAAGRMAAMDPELEAFVPLFPQADLTDPVADRETFTELSAAIPAPDTTGMDVEDTVVPALTAMPARSDLPALPFIPAGAEAAGVPVRIYRPHLARGAIVWLHGGGFVLGDLDTEHPWAARLAALSGAAVISVGYRRAPEHPFPAALDDACAALRWTTEHAVDLGLAPARIAVGGHSAGGGLAAATALWARDQHGPAICFQLLNQPGLDDRQETCSQRAFTDTPWWRRDTATRSWRHYLGGQQATPYAAPARAEDLSGLPPAYIATAELDPNRDEGIGYALRLLQAGVSVELHQWPGTFHGSQAILSAEVSQHQNAEIAAALRRALA